MADYISREAAIKKIRIAADCAECDGNSSDLCGCNFCDIYNAICLIKSLPATNVEQVRHGRWKRYSTTMMECSLCGKHTARHKFNYCPNCGAKMGLEDNDES